MLEDPAGKVLAHTCRLERRLNRQQDPVPVPEDLPIDRINILLVTARPYDADVNYRSISRPLIDLVRKEHLPANVTLLRPPTFDNLRAHLRKHKHAYHIVHFDGHGAYGQPADGGTGGTMPTAPQAPQHTFAAGPQGFLVFEDADGQPDLQPASTVSSLLQEHRIPAVVLNACQSATIDERADDAFASVAGALLKAGVRSVTAMAYSVYVSAAQHFLPAFYRRLFASGQFSEAVRAGRQELLAHRGRVCARGKYDLDDWLVPVLYEQDRLTLPFADAAANTGDEKDVEERLPEVSLPYGFIGRDGAILRLERALHRKPPVVLINGLGGIGKTTLALGFAEWLLATDGLNEGGVFWFDFREIRAAESVVNRIGEAFFGADFGRHPLDERVAALTKVLQQHRSLIVWDNFEVVWGIAGTPVEATLPSEDRELLKTFVGMLAGGKTKVVITSRSSETWLAKADRFKLTIGGLHGEERWDYCEAVLHAQQKTADRNDADLVKLLDLLGGHPLAMRVILPELEERTAGSLVAALEKNIAQFAGDGDAETDESKLFATLQFAVEALPDECQPLLMPLSLHEQCVDGDYLEHMARQVDETWTRGMIDGCLTMLCSLGLLTDRGQAVYELHPLVTRYLQARPELAAETSENEPWTRVFVDVMSSLADAVAPKPLHEQRGVFFQHEVNFHTALAHAERLQMDQDVAALVQSLAAYAQNNRNFAAAERLFTQFAEHRRKRGDDEGEAAAYHQLGRIAQEQRDFAAAEVWYRKSLDIKEKHGNEKGAASTYHQLGYVAQLKRDFAAAEASYRQALAISEKIGNEFSIAAACHQLGTLAQEQRDFAMAEHFHRKSLAISEKLGLESGATITYHQLGVLAQEQRDFASAENWYRKSLAIEEKLGNEHGAATTYHQMGRIAEEAHDFETAERWYRNSLAIKEKLGDLHGSAATYHQLGILAQHQRNLLAAAAWYRRSLAISQEGGDVQQAAGAYHQLGKTAALQEDDEQAATWFMKAAEMYHDNKAPHELGIATQNFIRAIANVDIEARTKLVGEWQRANLPPLPSLENA